MKQVKGIVNSSEVTLYAVERGEKVGSVRRAAGLGFDAIAILIGGPDADAEDADDYRHSFPETAKLLEANGVDLDNIIAVIEV